MGDSEQLTSFLCRNFGKAYCDECLSRELAMPLEQTRQLTTTLADEGWSKRSEGQCAGCSSVKLITRRRLSGFAC
jgi:hypothetical protein